jgi:beta-galactosidase
MLKKFSAISNKLPVFLHGGDYNPEQWLNYPGVFEEDIRLMKLAKCNTMSVGIFSWAALEPEEGKFNFEWLDNVIDKLYDNGIYTVLATPSGARPVWMAEKYPEVLRVSANRVKNIYGGRHNHCFTSPVYREKVNIINTKLADRYSKHPGVLMWHISNELGGDCHCELCQEAFRNWLKNKYKTIENLNHTWWATFWSHSYNDWSQIESPAPQGERMVHAMNLDWKRFVTDQTIDFLKKEVEPLRKANAELPVTTNLMELFDGLNYWKLKEDIDIISWDNYPMWHGDEDNSALAVRISMIHDIKRSLKGGKPFMLMESTPSLTNWQSISKLKKPGMHLLSSLQAVAHGSDTVQYFQWRKSRGASEKLHGAVVDHCGHSNTRVFKDVTEVGGALENLTPIIGSSVEPQVAVIFDWENRWAINDSQGPRNCGKKYEETVISHYKPFWNMGVPVDVIDMDCDFSKYKLLVAPMLYMVRPGVGERIESFVKAGGTFVATYWSGIVDENDLCFLGGFPGPLRKVLGIWSEEIDALYDHEVNTIKAVQDNSLGLQGSFEAVELCDLIHAETASVLAEYSSDFYAGMPAVTVNEFGKGKSYYIAARNKKDLNHVIYENLVKELNIRKNIDTVLPKGVTAQLRTDGDKEFIFLMNFSEKEQTVKLDGKKYIDMITKEEVQDEISLPLYGIKVLQR